MAPRILNFIAIYVLCFSVYKNIAVLRPRGVPLSRKIFYDPHHKFNCLDGSASVPFHFVNDDFCDCEDGSDEPGTSACPDGEFVCCNYGHFSKTIPSSRVNDGICDCCDGSDEFDSSADCFNNCKELRQYAVAAAKVVQEKYALGNETRQTYITEARDKKEEYRKQLNNLMDKEQELLRHKLQKQDLKDRAEDRERMYLGIYKEMKKEKERKHAMELKLLQQQKLQDDIDAKNAFEKLDKNKDGKITMNEMKSFLKFDYDGDGKVSEQEAMFYMNKKDEVNMEDFLTNGWRVVKAAFMMEEFSRSEPTVPADSHSESKRTISPSEVVEDIEMEIDESEKNAIFEDAAILRKEFADANKLLQDVQSDIWNVNKKLEMDFGPEDEFLALENTCFDFTDMRYMYRLCPFDKVVQVMRHNKDEVLLGLWENWCGTEGNLYSQMNFTRGSTCWNGPSRSVVVTLHCGLENNLVHVVESSPCVYVFTFETPAFCKDLPHDVGSILNNIFIDI